MRFMNALCYRRAYVGVKSDISQRSVICQSESNLKVPVLTANKRQVNLIALDRIL
jgi:hypothetical protein